MADHLTLWTYTGISTTINKVQLFEFQTDFTKIPHLSSKIYIKSLSKYLKYSNPRDGSRYSYFHLFICMNRRHTICPNKK